MHRRVPQGRRGGAQDETFENLNGKIAEYAKAVVDGRPNFHINIVSQVSPNCDCHAENDAAIVPDVGMFASFDPVAIDVACADAVNPPAGEPHEPHRRARRDARSLHRRHPPPTGARVLPTPRRSAWHRDYELITVK